MLRIVDRYVIREVIAPFAIVLVVFTFMLLMQPIMDVADQLISKGVSWGIVLRVLPTLLPQALALTIPMALLVALLIALGRLSEDREWVALQACGVSVYRLIRPVAVLALLGWVATSYTMLYALPDANQAYNEIIYPVLWSRADSQIKPRTFFQEFPGKVLYVRDVARDGLWTDVFLYDSGANAIYVARHGRMLVDRARRTAQIALEDSTSHKGPADKYEMNRVPGTLVLTLDPETIFPQSKIGKGYNQKTVAELNADIANLRAHHIPAVEEPMAIQQKFSIPVACLVFAAIGLGLGVSSRKDGKMASFVLGIGVICVYYVIMYGGRAGAKALVIPAWSAMWIPNVILGPAGIAVLIWRNKFSERPFRLAWLLRLRPNGVNGQQAAARPAAVLQRGLLRVRLPHLRLPRPRILDWYISKVYLRILALAFGALLLIFYIFEFIDLSERVFRGTAKPAMVLLYFFYKTPYFVYFILPIAGLIAALVSFGLLTRNSELVVMKACGISVYRAAVPLLVFALLSGSTLFVLEENVLATTNRRWTTYREIFKGVSRPNADLMNRGWVVSRDGRSIYHYDSFHFEKDQAGTVSKSELDRLSTYTFDPTSWSMTGRSFATRAVYSPGRSAGQATPTWVAQNGWALRFPANARAPAAYTVFKQRETPLEAPDYFGTEQPDAERMNYFDLKRYVAELRAGGFNETKASVDLQRKIAFPFVTLVMTLIAVPFAVTMGRRGAMYGIGLGVVLAIAYWVTSQVFAAFGAGGLLTPMLAAWAPNILFSGGAVYLLLTVRT